MATTTIEIGQVKIEIGEGKSKGWVKIEIGEGKSKGRTSKGKQDKVKSWRSGKQLAAGAYGAYYCTCPKFVPGHVHAGTCPKDACTCPKLAYYCVEDGKDGKDFTDGTIADEADALFGIESRFYID